MRQTLTLRGAAKTTGKSPQSVRRALVGAARLSAGVLALVFGGCATPGNLHVYSVVPTDTTEIRNTAATEAGRAEARDVPSYLGDDTLTGFAYDPYTDHFFLRLAPGNQIRVIDRPDRKIKREFTVDQMPKTGGGDLTVKPRTGHIYLVHPTEPALIELTRLAEWVGVIRLDGAAAGPVAGVAYDAREDALFVLTAKAGAEAKSHIVTHALDGRRLGAAVITLEREVVGGSLGFDAETREFYAPLAPAGSGLGVFDERGKLKRTLPSTATFVDVGPRSFIRVF